MTITRQHTLASLVAEGRIRVAETRPDADRLQHVVRGCFGCGGDEDARYSFTTYYMKADGKPDGCWFCQPCIKTVFNSPATEMVLMDLSEKDILVRNPDLREAYLAGRMQRTGDIPAGFVMSEEAAA